MKKLPLTEIEGDLRTCAARYGAEFRDAIHDFYTGKLQPDEEKLAYARSCIPFMEEGAPHAFQWTEGMAEAAGLTLEDATLLLLHEENYHNLLRKEGHCTALLSAGESSLSGETLCGQTWDWWDPYYPLPGILRTRIDGFPSVLSYHYPGLPFCCGVNEDGLALMWTGAGYLPPLEQKPGIPTYALTMETMMKDSVDEAVRYLQGQAGNAGCFIFLLGDASGDTAVVEGIPGYIQVLCGEPLICRSNLYMLDETVRRSAEEVEGEEDDALVRERAVQRKAKRWRGRIAESTIEDILTTPPLFRPMEGDVMTVDSLLANASQRTLLVSRGGKKAGPWRTYGF